MPTSSDFQEAMNKIFENAQREGAPFIEIVSADLHRRVGGYPGKSHRMPVCCNIMRQNMQTGDLVLSEPPKGAGATLKIRYQLPR